MTMIKVRYVIGLDDEVTAIFPELIGTDDPNTMMCYSHVGQHGICSMQWYNCNVIGATPTEFCVLHQELLEIYSDCQLYIINRIDPSYYQMRVAELAKLSA